MFGSITMVRKNFGNITDFVTQQYCDYISRHHTSYFFGDDSDDLFCIQTAADLCAKIV